MDNNSTFDIIIAGGGVLGVSIAYWLSYITNSKILLIDSYSSLGSGTTYLNSGMVEAPYFYDPSTKSIFGESVCRSRKLWRKLQAMYRLPWREVGSLEIALDEDSLGIIEKHEMRARSYCPDEEYKVIGPDEIKKIEPNLKAAGALLSPNDAATDYKILTETVGTLASHNSVQYLMNAEVISVSEKENFVEITVRLGGSVNIYKAAGFINATGGAALSLAHSMGLANDLAEIFIGSYYWKVNDAANAVFNHHVYYIAKYSSQYPFLEPYLTIRVDGSREIGPKPFLVGSYDYRKYGGTLDFLASIFKRPIEPKIKMLTNNELRSMIYNIMGNIFSENVVFNKVKAFIPDMKKNLLVNKHKSGKRNIIIGKAGIVHPTSIIQTQRTIHVLQYFEPGATGTPSFSSLLAKYLIDKWGLKKRMSQPTQEIWDYNFASEISLNNLKSLFIS